ncbi:hypothetical protein HY493_05420 [Candidatus Woesearchaeota archaeon]|nr:hypothetical protein [Candidatus Woesearchaeota archaeon]
MRLRQLFLAVTLAFLLAPLALAHEGESEAAELFENAMVWLNFAAAVACVIVAFATMNRAGSILGRAYVFITASILFFTGIRLFFFLTESTSVIAVTEATRAVWWHIMFYTATGLFLAALNALRTFRKVERTDMTTLATFFALGGWLVLLFALAMPLDSWTAGWFEATLWDRSGIIHFIAFAFIAYTWWMLLSLRKTFGKVVTAASASFLVSLAFFGFVHLWELLGESWNVLPFSSEVIELVEGPLFLVALIAFLAALWRIRSALPK